MFVKLTSPLKLLSKGLGAHGFALLKWILDFKKSNDVAIVSFEFNEVQNNVTLSGY